MSFDETPIRPKDSVGTITMGAIAGRAKSSSIAFNYQVEYRRVIKLVAVYGMKSFNHFFAYFVGFSEEENSSGACNRDQDFTYR